MSLMGKAISALGLGRSSDIAAPRQSAGYMRGGRGVLFGSWRPSLRAAQEEIGQSWDSAAARAVDSIMNSGFLTGAIEQAVANTVGSGLRLKCQPENSLFGMDSASAQKWSRQVEARFELWANSPQECDIQGIRTFGQMQAAAYQGWFSTGEVLGEIVWRKRPWNIDGTKVRLMQPYRLARDNDDARRLVNGVFVDADGMPIGYRTKRKDQSGMEVEVDLRARDQYGRQRVIHVFTGLPETFRGIGPLVSVLQVVRQFDQLADATLTGAVFQTIFAATIESDAPTEDVLAGLLTDRERAQMSRDGVSNIEAYMAASGSYYDNSTIDLGINGRLGHLFPGDKLNFQSPQNTASNYREFSVMLMREIARALGMDYSGASGDYTGSSYYTLGKSNTEIFSVTKARRAAVVAPMCQAVYSSWLEEQIEAGRIEFPGGIEAFIANRAAACRADWRGSPKPQADDFKAARSAETRKRIGIASDAMLCEEYGVDVEDLYEDLAKERAMREALGLPEVHLNGTPAADSSNDEANDDADA